MRGLQVILLTLGAILPGCRDAAPTAPLAPDGAVAGEQAQAGQAQADVLQDAASPSVRNAEETSPRTAPKTLVDPPSIGLPSITGQVIDVRTGLGKPGLVVWFNLGNGHSQETTTGPDGSFHVEPAWEFRKAAAIVRFGPNWRVVSRRPWLSEAEARGEEELRIEIAEIREAPVSGIALDAATGEPLPHLRFSLSRGRGTLWPKGLVAQTVETGPDGRFTTGGNVRGGMLYVRTLDGGPRPERDEVHCLHGSPESSPLLIPFLAAPTIELRLIGTTPADPTTLHASLWAEPIEQGLDDPRTPFQLYRTPVRRRADGSLWIRPPKPRNRPQPDVRLELVLRSPDGMLEGRAPVEYRPYDEPLEVTMVGTGTIAFRVNSEPVKAQLLPYETQHAQLELTSADASGAVFAKEHSRHSGTWKHLPPGHYVARAWSRAHELVEKSIRVEAGKEQQVQFELALETKTRTVRGSLMIERKGPPRSFDLEIDLAGPKPRTWRVHHDVVDFLMCGTGMDHSLDAAEDNRSGTFEIQGVPYGQLSARIDDPDRLFDIEISGEPDGDQFIRLREYSLATGLGFRVRQGEEPDDQHYRVRTRPLDGGPPLEMRVANGEPVLEGVPGERRFEWILWSSSAGPVLGTHEDFIETTPGVYFADVELPPYGNWTPLLTIVDEAGQAVADAAVLLDGKPAQLGPRGELPLIRKDKANTYRSLEISAPGFQPFQRIEWRALSGQPELTVILERL